MMKYFRVAFRFVSVTSRCKARTSVNKLRFVDEVHEYGPACINTSGADVGLAVCNGPPGSMLLPGLPKMMVPLDDDIVFELIVAVVEIDGNAVRDVPLNRVCEDATVRDLLASRAQMPLASNAARLPRSRSVTLAEVVPVVEFNENDVPDVSDASVVVALVVVREPPSCTGQRLQRRRVTSQYTSISNLLNPVANKLEKHFAACTSSYRLLEKQAGVKFTAGTVTKLTGT